jgi:hypothetical protein
VGWGVLQGMIVRFRRSAQFALVGCLGAQQDLQRVVGLVSSSVVIFLSAMEHLDVTTKATVHC